MTRSVLFAAAAAAALAPVASQAQVREPSQARVEIVGTAPSACVILGPAAASGRNAVFQPTGSSSGQIAFGELVDPVTAQPRAAGMDLAIPVICNSPHRVVLRSANGGLRLAGQRPAPGTGFADLLAYRLDSSWGGRQASFSSDQQGPFVIEADGARAGQMALSFSLDEGGRPLVAGIYSDQIVLEFQAAN